MARQAATTRKPVPPKAVTPPRARKGQRLRLEGLSTEQQVARLLADREDLVARVTDLERQLEQHRQRQSEVADRLAWALDNLRDLLSSRA